jgi:hypothetical protein
MEKYLQFRSGLLPKTNINSNPATLNPSIKPFKKNGWFRGDINNGGIKRSLSIIPIDTYTKNTMSL